MILAYIGDLMFRSKVKEAAALSGRAVRFVRDIEAFKSELAASSLSLVILDLEKVKPDLADVVKIAKSTGVPTVGYLSHLEADLAESASSLGVESVMPRSQFVKMLPSLVAAHPGREAERGIGKFTALVFGAIIIAAGYAAYTIVPWFYYYYELENHFYQMIRVAQSDDDRTIRRKLMYYVNRYELPVEPEELSIERFGRTMRISLKWSETFSIPWFGGTEKDIHTFHFHALAEDEF